MSLRSVCGLLTGAVAATALLAAAAAQQFQVSINGKPLAQAVRLEEEIYVPVSALLRAVDGPTHAARLRVAGRQLYGAAEGGCLGCALRVRRAVLISSRLRRVTGELCLPLSDLVRALEGRLEVDHEARIYAIYAGACSWCVLEPRSP